MKKYLEHIKKINKKINCFNKFLAETNKIKQLPEDGFKDSSIYLNTTNWAWGDPSFPSSDKRGVYFIFGYNEQNPEELGLYVGKSSFSAFIGSRLWNHLIQIGDTNQYYKKVTNTINYRIELIAAIDFDSKGISFLAPALEEFLIDKLKDDITLMNKVGN